MSTAFAKNKQALLNTTVKMTKAIEKNSSTHALGTLDLLGHEDDLHELLDKEKFALAHRSTMVTQACGAYQASLSNQPLPGVASIITCVFGYCHVLALDLDVVLAAGFAFETIAGFLENVDQGVIGKMPMFGLSEGKSRLIPFGQTPIVVGLSSDDEEGIDYNSYMTSYYYGEDARAASEVVRAEVGGSLVKSCARESKFQDANRDNIKKWVLSWEFFEVTSTKAKDANESRGVGLGFIVPGGSAPSGNGQDGSG